MRAPACRALLALFVLASAAHADPGSVYLTIFGRKTLAFDGHTLETVGDRVNPGDLAHGKSLWAVDWNRVSRLAPDSTWSTVAKRSLGSPSVVSTAASADDVLWIFGPKSARRYDGAWNTLRLPVNMDGYGHVDFGFDEAGTAWMLARSTLWSSDGKTFRREVMPEGMKPGRVGCSMAVSGAFMVLLCDELLAWRQAGTWSAPVKIEIRPYMVTLTPGGVLYGLSAQWTKEVVAYTPDGGGKPTFLLRVDALAFGADSHGNLWVSDGKGVAAYDPKGHPILLPPELAHVGRVTDIIAGPSSP